MSAKEALYEFFRGVEVLGPGSEDTTTRLLELIPKATEKMNAIDIGCGTGRSSIVLAEHDFKVTAVDDYQPFLDAIDEKAIKKRFSNRISTLNRSMNHLDLPNNSFDLVWSEASVYVLGFKKALQDWKRLLKSNGFLVVTECCWTNDNPPKEVSDFWAVEYPGMLTVDEALRITEEVGYRVVSKLTLPESDWDNYYCPLSKRVKELEKDARSEMKQVIDDMLREITLRDNYKSYYDYVAFILKLS